MTSLRLLVAYPQHAELYVLGCKFVVRQSHGRAHQKHLAAFLFIILLSSITKSSLDKLLRNTTRLRARIRKVLGNAYVRNE